MSAPRQSAGGLKTGFRSSSLLVRLRPSWPAQVVSRHIHFSFENKPKVERSTGPFLPLRLRRRRDRHAVTANLQTGRKEKPTRIPGIHIANTTCRVFHLTHPIGGGTFTTARPQFICPSNSVPASKPLEPPAFGFISSPEDAVGTKPLLS
jgi:hypothetical protein